MEFILETARNSLFDGDIDKLKRNYPNLDFDKFNIKEKVFEYFYQEEHRNITLVTITINTLEELLEFKKIINQDLIIENNIFIKDKLEIMIYDDYIE